MASYAFTEKALDDLNNIWFYTLEEWSEEQADRYYFMLLSTCQNIANNPESGKNYEGITPDLFGLRISRHIIFYRKLANQPIEITRILHGKMELKTRIKK